jgi:hypothetical protein
VDEHELTAKPAAVGEGDEPDDSDSRGQEAHRADPAQPEAHREDQDRDEIGDHVVEAHRPDTRVGDREEVDDARNRREERSHDSRADCVERDVRPHGSTPPEVVDQVRGDGKDPEPDGKGDEDRVDRMSCDAGWC